MAWKGYKPWTNEEKTQLMTSLHQFGASDLSSISATIPSRTKTEITAQINNYEKESIADATELFCCDIPIDQWLKIVLKNTEYSSPCIVARVFKYIKLFEKLQEPENELSRQEKGVNVVDVKHCYDLMSDLSAGLPPKGSQDATNVFFIKALKNTAKAINEDGMSKKRAMDFLHNFSLLPVNMSNTYSRRPRVTDSDAILNPLKAPTNIYHNVNNLIS